jgi:hypothetical protein
MRMQFAWRTGAVLLSTGLTQCVPAAAPSYADVFLPVGTRADVARVVLPAEPVAANACLAACADVSRVAATHHRCLARCPGARYQLGARCDETTAGRCLERVVAVPEPNSAADREIEQATLAGLAVLAYVAAHIAVAVLCEDDWDHRRCADDP